MDPIEFREATRADAGAIGVLHVASWHETYAGIVPDAMLAGLSVEKRTAMWRRILGDPEAHGDAAVFVAEEGAQMIGFGSCGRQRDGALAEAGYGGEIGAIYVARSHQNRGVGRAIMARMAKALSDRGHDAASLWVLRDNVPARTFYEGLGGEIVGEKKDERPDGIMIEMAYGWRNLSRLVR